MKVIKANRAPMLNKAGKETMSAKRSFLIPFAALISRRILPILNTLTTRSRVGETGKSVMRSSMRIPTMEAITRTKSKRFHAAVK